MEKPSKVAFANKFTRALIATTCLTAGSAVIAKASTITEGSNPAPSDFGNSNPGYLLPVGTDTVFGSLVNGSDPNDWFKFQGLAAGTLFNINAVYSPFGQEAGVSLHVYNTSGTQLALGTLESSGAFLSGTVPTDGFLIADLTGNRGGAYRVVLSAQQGVLTPEPGTMLPVGLALAGAFAWQRRRKSVSA